MLSPVMYPKMSWMLLSCLMFLSNVQGEDPQKDMASPRISCPTGSQAYGSHCYALFRIKKNWFDADLACQKRPSGHLVSVLSAAEASFVSSLVKNRVSGLVWMGLHDPTLGQESNGGGWEWSNSDVLNYFNWENDSCVASIRGFCGSLTQDSNFLKWRDQPCDEELPYVCKFKN